jgi:hypothetical protein
MYSAMLLEQLKVYAVADRLVELFQQGALPIGRNDAAHALLTQWSSERLSPSAEERRRAYVEVLDHHGGTGDAEPDREFPELWQRFISVVRAVNHQPVVEAAQAEPLRVQVEVLRRLFADPEITSACAARDLDVRRVSSFEREGRAALNQLLAASVAFARLPQAAQNQVARDTSVVADFLADVDFPHFVASLIAGTFDAILTASIEQMEAYASFVAAVSASLDDFRAGAVTETGMRDHLADQFSDLLEPSCGRASDLGLAAVLIHGVHRIEGSQYPSP